MAVPSKGSLPHALILLAGDLLMYPIRRCVLSRSCGCDIASIHLSREAYAGCLFRFVLVVARRVAHSEVDRLLLREGECVAVWREH